MQTPKTPRISSLISILFLFVFVAPLIVSGQTRPSVSIRVTPESYAPSEQVLISVSSFSTTLDTATIRWEVDGETVREGTGVKEIKVQAPAAGEEKQVYVLVTSENIVIEKIITLRPESIELYLESVDGYTPVWYQGRAQIAEESVVKVVAVPDSFNAIGGDTVRVFTWSKNNFKDANQSGKGRQAFITKLSPFTNSENISVETGNTSKTLSIVPHPTSISLYEYSPLFGTRFEKELTGSLSLTKDDVTFEVVPWFFSAPNRNSSILSISWTVNGLPTRSQGNRSLLNLRKGTTQKGRAEVGVRVKHTDRTLQTNTTSFTIDL